ncbi:MAG TPA: Fe-S cluster protein, partial [Synergistaceae bacterium]|nr:Fe-S cluster protein [Synergistaceae bacterium]
MPDPTFYIQIGAYSRVPLMREALELHGYHDLSKYAATAFDVAAFAAAGIIRDNKEKRPYISSYCPAIIRLIQINFPELVGRILPVESPLEAAVHMWKKDTGSRDKVTLVSPCPAKTAL